MIPITILTGFLGAGKTTILNKIIEQNPQIKFGLIINEFGEVGIDGQLVEDSGQEMVEISNGCLCCVVRGDLLKTTEKMIETGKVDYIIIETSGLAEPKPVAETFIANDLEGKVRLDGIICVIDTQNYGVSSQNYQTAIDQLEFCDIILLNKLSDSKEGEVAEFRKIIAKVNPWASILENTDTLSTKLLIETGKWTTDRLEELSKEAEDSTHEHHEDEDHSDHDHEHHHHHEHNNVDEIVFKTPKALSPDKLDNWLQNQFPKNVVRAKGITQIATPNGKKWFVFQMVGASKTLQPFTPKKPTVDSCIVLIGKELDKETILKDLEKTAI